MQHRRLNAVGSSTHEVHPVDPPPSPPPLRLRSDLNKHWTMLPARVVIASISLISICSGWISISSSLSTGTGTGGGTGGGGVSCVTSACNRVN